MVAVPVAPEAEQSPNPPDQQKLEHGIEIFDRAFIQVDEHDKRNKVEKEAFEWLERDEVLYEWLERDGVLSEWLEEESFEERSIEKEVSEWLARVKDDEFKGEIPQWSTRVVSEWLEIQRLERENREKEIEKLKKEIPEIEKLRKRLLEIKEFWRRTPDMLRLIDEAFEMIRRPALQIKNNHERMVLLNQKLRSLEEELERETREKRRLRRFHSNFVKQYEHLKKATEDPSTRIHQLLQQPHGYRQVWDAAITTMRRLSRLKALPSLRDALCFLCVSKAVAETDDINGAHASAFYEGLEQWRIVFPEIEDAARLMWNITFECIPQQQPTAKQHDEMLKLRDSVAALIEVSNGLFDLGGPNFHNRTNAHQVLSRPIDEASLHKDSFGHLITSKEKEPPDGLICPAIASLREKTYGTPRFNIAILVVTAIFALVVYFMLGFAHISSPTVLELPNPWYTNVSQTNSPHQSKTGATSSLSYIETASPSLLSRPSSPFDTFHPNLGVPSSPLLALDEFSFDIPS
ncbi:hypothetical protein F5X98DRAFT_377298 [Xylaria grammica]|nr:hypothetical protein F5X98DRAFT_377298 [Xylaria grammica]